jgi:hypothetical protein
MIARFIFGLLAIFYGSSAWAQEYAPQYAPLPACEIVDEQSVYWQAMGEQVILRTTLLGAEDTLPRAKLMIEFNDGEIVVLGNGGKYIDDFMPGDEPTCQDHLIEARNATLSSLDPAHPILKDVLYMGQGTDSYSSMAALQADLREARLCDPNYKTNPGAYDCQNLQDLAARVAENRNEIPQPLFDQLVTRDAPIIDLTYSSYGIDTFVFDPTTKKLHQLYYNGC